MTKDRHKAILVPLDFTDVADYALDHGISMAHIFEYKLFLLHVLPNRQKGSEKERQASERLEQLASQISKDHDLDVHTQISYGHPFDTIQAEAEALEVDFVVMGVHGKKGVAHLVRSQPYKVVCQSQVPVLVVKEEHHHVGFHNIIVPIDFSRRSAQKIAQAKKFAKFFGAKIRVFGFLSSQNKAKIINKEALLKSVTDFFIRHNISVTTDLMVNPKMGWPEALISFADKVEADLIMIVAEKGNRFQDIFSKNYTERILDDTNIPVLSILPCPEDFVEEDEAIKSKEGIITPFVDPLGFFARAADI